MIIDESQTAKGFTPAGYVPQVYGRARTIESLTIHHWGELGQTHDGVVNFFAHGPGQTSAHFVASAGRVNCLVNPADAAWHAGNAVGNATSIGIECRPEATDGDYQTVAELVAYLRGIYGNLPLIPHRDWQATACPGVWDLDRIDSLAGKTAPGTLAPQGTITPEQGFLMALNDADQTELLAHARDINTDTDVLIQRTADLGEVVENVRKIVWQNVATQQGLSKLDGPSIASTIPTELAQQVIDALAARLGGK